MGLTQRWKSGFEVVWQEKRLEWKDSVEFRTDEHAHIPNGDQVDRAVVNVSEKWEVLDT